jgi:hypothetical protein
MLGRQELTVGNVQEIGELPHEVFLVSVQSRVAIGDPPKLAHDRDPFLGAVVAVDE